MGSFRRIADPFKSTESALRSLSCATGVDFRRRLGANYAWVLNIRPCGGESPTGWIRNRDGCLYLPISPYKGRRTRCSLRLVGWLRRGALDAWSNEVAAHSALIRVVRISTCFCVAIGGSLSFSFRLAICLIRTSRVVRIASLQLPATCFIRPRPTFSFAKSLARSEKKERNWDNFIQHIFYLK